MQSYELILILPAGLTEEKTDAIIQSLGVEVTARTNWGMRLFAYPIKKQKEGNYILCEFSSDSKTVNTMMKKLNIDDSIIRYMLVRKER